MKRSSTAVWSGTGKEGKGTLSTQSGTLNETPYNYVSRFENGGDTNPEELIAAAHAGCFNMKLSFVVGNSGFTPDHLKTTCTITLGDGEITDALLELTASIPGMTEEQFEEAVTDAVTNCPISRLFNVDISVEAELEVDD